MPTVRQIQHFCAVLASGTAQGAARAVHVSQPALTRSICNLENELGLKLFERSKSGMRPTEFGEQVAPRFEQLLLEMEDIQREALLYQNLESGRLRIGFGQAVREPLVRHCLPRFVERHPGVALTVSEGTAMELAAALQRREVDIIIAGAASYEEYGFAASEHIRDIQMLVMVRQGHPLAHRDTVLMKELVNYPQAAPTSLGAQHEYRRRSQSPPGPPMKPHFLCSDYKVLESIVRTTDSWTVSPATVLHRDRPDSLFVLNVADFDLKIELSAIEVIQRSRSPAADRFIQIVKSILTDG